MPGSIPRIISLSFKNYELSIVNKNTKIWLKYIAGAAILLLLLWSIYVQVTKQLAGINANLWKQTGPTGYLLLCICLMFVNVLLESWKWFLLSNSVEPLSYFRALCSYLTGMACSIITPNRIGDYPGRILYLGRSNTFRYVNVSILGAMSQLSAIFFFGLAGLVYYNIAFPAIIAKMALGLCLVGNIFIAVVYWRFEAWLPVMGKITWLRRFAIYGRLLNRVTTRKQIIILGVSILRFSVFTAQYLFLLEWMNVNVPLAEGFFMAALFFWVMAVIPSIALAELGIRGNVSLYLFHHFSSNTVGMLAATSGIWLLNLVLPSILGSILIMRMRLLN